MSTHTIDEFITWRHTAWTDRPEVDFLTFDPREAGGNYVVVRAHSIEVPDDPRSAAALREKATFSAHVIDASISKLLAIE